MIFLEAKNGKFYIGQLPILLRGFGLGGWLLPEGYMWGLYDKCDRPRRMERMIEALCGIDYAKQFWQRYYKTYITKADIKLIAENGFNSVRLPINARHLYFLENGQMSFNSETIALIDEMISWCKQYEIYVVLDMHGAPGGQTGANIDDCLEDLPSLFMNKEYEDELVELWGMLAKRYKDEPAIAGYDLLNEPLPNWFNQYNHMLMPLYEKLIKKIRAVDSKHLIILEGLHWATDFSVFDQLSAADVKDGIALEFHKYWSNPDIESITVYIQASQRLNIPLFMGESGENNLEWYATMFPLLERMAISWSFWSYKKMDCINSPITFDRPNNWDRIEMWAEQNDGFLKGSGEIIGNQLETFEAQAIFEDFLLKIAQPKEVKSVINALIRKAPVVIPAEAYDDFQVREGKVRCTGADLRRTEPIDIIFENGKIGEVDYKRNNGADQPLEENLLVVLHQGETVSYGFCADTEFVEIKVTLKFENSGELTNISNNTASNIMRVTIEDQIERYVIDQAGSYTFKFDQTVKSTYHQLIISCESGKLLLDDIILR